MKRYLRAALVAVVAGAGSIGFSARAMAQCQPNQQQDCNGNCCGPGFWTKGKVKSSGHHTGSNAPTSSSWGNEADSHTSTTDKESSCSVSADGNASESWGVGNASLSPS